MGGALLVNGTSSPYRALDTTDGLTGIFADGGGLSGRTSAFESGLGITQTVGMFEGTRAFTDEHWSSAPVIGRGVVDGRDSVIGGSLPIVNARVEPDLDGQISDFKRAFSGGYLGVMEGLNPSAGVQAGKVAREAWDSTKQFGYDMVGAKDADMALNSLAAGDYRGAAVYGAKSFANAAMAVGSVFGMGTVRPLAVPGGAAAPELIEGSYSLLGANRAVIDPRKLTEYALNPEHPVGGNKARVFESAMGFTKSNAEDLMQQLRQGVMSNTPIAGKVDQFGSRFTVDIPVTGPIGNGTFRSGWIYKPGSNVPELTTIFVK
ncbi:DUF6883 domain-containing protein [Cupriavidus sp. 30B13]|uniref:DUF6883 domain-containing protein n=1 Tax=Cupriavidus sp. 30B13 TaxID=3384241 RepID=UPI003B90DC56